MQICVGRIKRTKDSPWENGLIISRNNNAMGDASTILDTRGEIVPEIWDFNSNPWADCINIEFPKDP